MSKPLERRIEDLEQTHKSASFPRMTREKARESMAKRLAEIAEEERKCQALPTAKKIGYKKREVAEIMASQTPRLAQAAPPSPGK